MVTRDPLTILIQRIAHDTANLNPYLHKYQDILNPLNLTLCYIRFSTNGTVPFHFPDLLENYIQLIWIQLLIYWKQNPNQKPPQSFFSRNPGFQKLEIVFISFGYQFHFWKMIPILCFEKHIQLIGFLFSIN